jgi:hypothetical protein
MLTFTKGNGKLKTTRAKRRANARRWGTPVYNFNLRAVTDCPGATPECIKLCYAGKGRYLFNGTAFERNREIADTSHGIVERVENLPQGAWVRIHTSGDFYSAAYVDKWRMAALMRPDVKFWAYTRSWSVKRILPSLERFRALPNVQLFASVDSSTTGSIPAGWRIASLWAKGTAQPGGLVCPEQTGAMSDCLDCGYCILGRNGNVAFIEH